MISRSNASSFCARPRTAARFAGFRRCRPAAHIALADDALEVRSGIAVGAIDVKRDMRLEGEKVVARDGADPGIDEPPCARS